MNLDSIKYILKTFILILIISLLLDKVVFFVLNKISDKVFAGQSIGKLNQYLQKKDSLEFIVFGSSRANHNVNPIKLSKNSYNMGMDGRKLAYSSTLIKLLPKNKKQIILLHIDTENAFKKDYTGNDILPLSIKYNRNNLIKQEIDRLNKNNLLQIFYWSLSYNRSLIGVIKNFWNPNYNYKTYYGYDPIYVSEKQKNIFKNILRISENKIVCQDSLVLNKIYNDYIDELRGFCEKNNKTIIFFTSPKFEDKCKRDNIELSQILKNKNLTYYDFTLLLKDNNNLEYWKDKLHLSNKGAELFTEKLTQKLQINNYFK